MTELLENSDNTNADTKVSESPSNEATISLSTVQALADALQKIESYTPTVWVDNESPDIDAAHLNKAEQAIMRVTTAMNSAVDVIKDLQSQVNTTNNNLSNRIPSTKASYSMNNLPKLQQSSTKDQERATILEWFNSLPNYSYGMSTMHTNNPKGFFRSGGTRLLSAYRSQDGNYGGIFVLPYWNTEGPSFATVENGTLSDLHQLALKDDLGVTEYNAGKTINISGKLSDIGKWLQTNGVTARWMSARVDPINTDGYFGKSTFSILWQCSSADYGWCILMSDNSKMVVFGRNTGGWHWYAPSLSEVS